MDFELEKKLVGLAAGGDRHAYGRIVERYQSLVCSVTYSACGDLSQSEDLAQETFISAWKNLSKLKDLARFKYWLLGIARNVTNSALRVRVRRSASAVVSLEDAGEPAAEASPPGEAAIIREEEALVWQSLETIPEQYREPLVLFYRQDKSLADVAAALDLSVDVAKQRLHRGRTMLKQKVERLVENTLSRSRPGKAFTIATLAALPAISAEAAAAGLAMGAAKGSAAAKAAVATSLWGAVLGPILGLLGAYLGTRASIASARTPRERSFMKKVSWLTFGLATLFSVGVLLLIFFHDALTSRSTWLFGSALAGLILLEVALLTALIIAISRHHKKIQEEERDRNAVPPATSGLNRDFKGKEFKSKLSLLGLPLVHVATGSRIDGVCKRGIAKGWIAIGDISLGVLFSCGGIAVGGIAIGGIAAGGISFAGMALGGIALGGGAIGWIAAGGLALAWHFSLGGAAIAHSFALGGLAIAEQANNDLVQTELMENPITSTCKTILDHSRWSSILLILPVYFVFKNRRAQGRS